MSFRRRVALATLLASLAVSATVPVSAGSGTTTRWVDDDGRAGPNGCGGSASAATKVQAAVNASDRNDTIIVCPGTYVGTVAIEGDRRGLTIKATGQWTARLKPPKGAPQQQALVVVDRVRDVTIQHLELVFPTTGDCGVWTAGIFADEAHGMRLMGDYLRPIGGPSLYCGFHTGILVDNSDGIRISSVLLRDFMKTGMDLIRTSGRIHGNSLRYLHEGNDDALADYGIHLTDTQATVSANVVRAGGRQPTGDSALEYGLYVQGEADGTLIRDNLVRHASVGISLGSSGVTISDTTIEHATIYGLLVADAPNVMRRNVIRNAPSGAACYDVTSGSGTEGTGNTWTDNQGDSSSPSGICRRPY
jgi:hypothetical protein